MLLMSLQVHRRYLHSVSDLPVRLETTSERENGRLLAALFDEGAIEISMPLLRAASATPFFLVATFAAPPTVVVGLPTQHPHIVSMAMRISARVRTTASTTKLSTIAGCGHLPHVKVMIRLHHRTR